MNLTSSKNVALSVEGMAVRMMAYSGKKVEAWYELPLNSAWVRNGIISRPDEVGKAIAASMEEHKLPHKGAVSALPGTGSSGQVLNLPGIKKDRIGEAATRELKRLAPGTNTENEYILTEMLPKKGSQQGVYTLTVPKRNVLNFMEACQTAGLGVKSIELTPFALARAVGCENGIIVHAEVDNIEIVIVQGSFPASFRTVVVQSGAGPEAAAQQLLNELPRTIDYYNRSHQEAPLADDTPVYLSGALALDPELVMGVVDVTGREVANAEPTVEYPPEFPLAQYMAHVGLMLGN